MNLQLSREWLNSSLVQYNCRSRSSNHGLSIWIWQSAQSWGIRSWIERFERSILLTFHRVNTFNNCFLFWNHLRQNENIKSNKTAAAISMDWLKLENCFEMNNSNKSHNPVNIFFFSLFFNPFEKKQIFIVSERGLKPRILFFRLHR